MIRPAFRRVFAMLRGHNRRSYHNPAAKAARRAAEELAARRRRWKRFLLVRGRLLALLPGCEVYFEPPLPPELPDGAADIERPGLLIFIGVGCEWGNFQAGVVNQSARGLDVTLVRGAS